MKLRLGIRRARCRTRRYKLFARAGFNVYVSSRSISRHRRSGNRVHADRAQEMTRYVCEGVLDAGLTGFDWVAEHRLGRDPHACVTSLADLVYSKQSFGKVRWVLAAPKTRASTHLPILRARRSRPNSCR